MTPFGPDSDLIATLRYCFDAGGFTTRSDYARSHADHIAKASYLRLITTSVPGGAWGNVWRLTGDGFHCLFKETPPPCLPPRSDDA